MTTTTTSVSTYQMYIGGQWVDAASGGTFESLNPYTGSVWARIPEGQDSDVDMAVTAAQKAMEDPAWKRMGPTRRGMLMRRLGELIGENADHLGHVETRDNGKLIREMLAQARFSLEVATLNQELLAWERTYNTVRPHQALGYLTPLQFVSHRQHQLKEVKCH